MLWPVPFSPSPCAHWQSFMRSAQPLPAYSSPSHVSVPPVPCYAHPRCFLVLPSHPCLLFPLPASPSPSYRLGPHDTTDADVRLHNHRWPPVLLEQRLGHAGWGKWLQNLLCPVFKRV